MHVISVILNFIVGTAPIIAIAVVLDRIMPNIERPKMKKLHPNQGIKEEQESTEE